MASTKLTLSLVLLLFTSRGLAAEWNLAKSVSTGVVYTDNVCLSDGDEQGEFIGTLTPGFALSANGNRADFRLAASAVVNTLTDGKLRELNCQRSPAAGGRKQFAPRLRGAANLELVENWLYFDSSASIDQNRANSFEPGGDDEFDRRGNTNTQYRYALNPYIQHKFGSLANFSLRYNWDEQVNSVDGVDDSEKERIGLLLKGLPNTSRLRWGIEGSYNNVSYQRELDELTRESELSRAQLNLGLQLNRQWLLSGSAGAEDNDFVSTGGDIDGGFWSAMIRWTPNSRTVVDIGSGERFFGSTPKLLVNYSHKRVSLRVNYAKRITFTRDIRALEEFGDPVADPFDGSAGGVGNDTFRSRSPIIDERFTLNLGYQGRVSNFNLTASVSDQLRTADDQDVAIRGVSASFDRQIARRIKATADIGWSEWDSRGVETDVLSSSDQWRARLGLSRKLSNVLSLALNYSYTDRQSRREFQTYTENRITLSLQLKL